MMMRLLGAAVAAVMASAALSACAAPQPRYPIVLDAAAAQPTPLTAEAAARLETAPPAEAPAATAPVVETAMAAPVGSVQTASLPVLSLPQTQPPPTPEAEPVAAPVADPSIIHVVGAGETYFAVGRRYGVSPQAVAEVNGVTFADTLRVGQQLRLPVGARDKGPQAAFPNRVVPAAIQLPAAVAPGETPATRFSARVAAPAPPPAAISAPPAVVAAAAVPAASRLPQVAAAVTAPRLPPAVAAASASAPSIADAKGRFAWPVRGPILSSFGPRGPGQRNDGINIAAAEGDSIQAAAAGEVVYAGDQVPGFGKLVLLKHADGWVTAYAHLSEIGVRMREKVSQGAEIGKAGRTGAVDAPQLHFEVRHAPSPQDKARPVDPVPLLPPL